MKDNNLRNHNYEYMTFIYTGSLLNSS